MATPQALLAAAPIYSSRPATNGTAKLSWSHKIRSSNDHRYNIHKISRGKREACPTCLRRLPHISPIPYRPALARPYGNLATFWRYGEFIEDADRITR